MILDIEAMKVAARCLLLTCLTSVAIMRLSPVGLFRTSAHFHREGSPVRYCILSAAKVRVQKLVIEQSRISHSFQSELRYVPKDVSFCASVDLPHVLELSLIKRI